MNAGDRVAVTPSRLVARLAVSRAKTPAAREAASGSSSAVRAPAASATQPTTGAAAPAPTLSPVVTQASPSVSRAGG